MTPQEALVLFRKRYRFPWSAIAREFGYKGSRHLMRRLDGIRPAFAPSARETAQLKAGAMRLVHRPAPRFFIHPEERPMVAAQLRAHYGTEVEEVLNNAEDICAHRFDLLGSGPIDFGSAIDWHLDFRAGHRFPLLPWFKIQKVVLENDADIKVPWELSRFHHLVALGQAYWLTGEERYVREGVAQLESWWAANPVGYGIHWTNPMEAAIRSVNWMWALYLFAGSRAATPDLFGRWVISLYEHGAFIHRNLEYSTLLNSNHYVANLVGLVYLGLLLPETKATMRWRATGLAGLVTEARKQVLPDGVNIEGSVGYHRLVTELFLSAGQICRLNGIFLPEDYWERLRRMLHYICAYLRPDGSSPAVGDADEGQLLRLAPQMMPDHRELLAIGAVLFKEPLFKAAAESFPSIALWQLGEEGLNLFEAIETASTEPASMGFPDGGGYVLRQGKLHCYVQRGQSGRRRLTGHTHNDILSFECFANGAPLIVDSGTYTYSGEPRWRNRFRSTAAHNTVRVDEAEINRFHPDRLFDLEIDAHPVTKRWDVGKTYDCLELEHDGYGRLADPVRHERQFVFDKAGQLWFVTDTLDGQDEHRVEWFFHFAPEVTVNLEEPDEVVAIHPEGSGCYLLGLSVPVSWRVDLVPGWVAPWYGLKVPTVTLRATYEGLLPCTVRWAVVPFNLNQLPSGREARAWALDQWNEWSRKSTFAEPAEHQGPEPGQAFVETVTDSYGMSEAP